MQPFFHLFHFYYTGAHPWTSDGQSDVLCLYPLYVYTTVRSNCLWRTVWLVFRSSLLGFTPQRCSSLPYWSNVRQFLCRNAFLSAILSFKKQHLDLILFNLVQVAGIDRPQYTLSPFLFSISLTYFSIQGALSPFMFLRCYPCHLEKAIRDRIKIHLKFT